MTYVFVQTDGGRRQDTKRRNHGKDCMVRALAVATGVPYAQVYDELVAEGVFSPKRGGFMDRLVGQLNFADMDFHGFKFQWISFPAVKGKPRMHADKFAEQFPTGTYLLRMGHHICCMADGVLYDMFSHTDRRCVYGAWQLKVGVKS